MLYVLMENWHHKVTYVEQHADKNMDAPATTQTRVGTIATAKTT
jgi:hypothetical protein